MMALQQLGAYVADSVRGSLTPPVRERLRLHVIDTVGAWVATAATQEARALTAFRDEMREVSPGDLALEIAINCALPRLSEADDIHFASMITPGAIVVPSALTIAAALPRYDADVLAQAIVAGYEVMVRFGAAIDGGTALYRGIWPTYFAAPLGVAAVAARLLDLNAEQAAHALALALNLTSPGVGHHSTSTTSRWLAIGGAARNGLLAARAAQAGFTSDTAMLDGRFLSNVYGISPDLSAFTEDLGGTPKLMDVSFKPWCAARQTMAATQAFKEIITDGVAPDVITAIEASVPAPMLRMIDHGIAVEDRLSRLTSLPYQFAVAALSPDDAFDVAQASREIPPAIQSFMTKVKVASDDMLMQGFPQMWRACVRVQVDGAWREHQVTHIPGDPEQPFDDAAVRQKLHRLVGRAESLDKLMAEVQSVLDGRLPSAQLLTSIEDARAVAMLR